MPESMFGSGLSALQFKNFTELIWQESGIRVPEDEKDMLVSRLVKRMLALKLDTFDAYYTHLHREPSEKIYLIDSVSTNMTGFFREPKHFGFLKGDFLNAIRQRRSGTGSRKISIWSVASSTGEEPYSIAISVLEGLGSEAGWELSVLASDISTSALGRLETATYDEIAMKGVPEALKKKYFVPAGSVGGRAQHRVVESVRKRILGRRINLHDKSWPVSPGFDAIFCRNVLIYFDNSAQKELVCRLCGYVAMGGYLVLASPESIMGKKCGLELVTPGIFKKVGTCF
ncbi:MAG: protein-glutamate O-methyltransferase CheR [Proteobacteria bacterium]|nr:protein-glutamate O-methyltransferase CheR [Pseudomonadota bacterium]